MTISRDRRLADQARVLQILATDLGNDLIVQKWWDVDRPDLADVVLTTWAELVEKGLLRRHRRMNPPPAYELTEAGWMLGLKIAGVLDSTPFRERCIELVKFFKSQVAGRQQPHDAFPSHDEIGKRFPFLGC